MILLIMTLWMNAFAANNDSLVLMIKKSKIPSSSLGLWIEGTDRQFSHNAETGFVPASLSKIPTAGAALQYLGLHKKFATSVHMTGFIKNEELFGDLYLRGGGDPSLVSENFWSIINELKRSGFRKINGKVYVDDFLFDDDRYSQGRQNRRVDRAYDAPIGALSFNWNSVNVYVRPGLAANLPAKVFLDPENEYVRLVNKCKTSKKTNIIVERETGKNEEVITVSGTIAEKEPEKVIYKNVSDPELWAGYNFKAFLNRDGITYTDAIERKRVPSEAQLLVNFESKPFIEIIADMSKFSNNYVAEMLTKSMSRVIPASLESGLARIHEWIESAGVPSTQYTFVSPSGFSNENRFTPKDLGKILQFISADFKVAAEFKATLPLSGVDGTLKSRLKDMSGQVRAKTGYLAGKVGLAGYFTKRDKEYAFVFIYNGDPKFDPAAKALFDDLIRQW